MFFTTRVIFSFQLQFLETEFFSGCWVSLAGISLWTTSCQVNDMAYIYVKFVQLFWGCDHTFNKTVFSKIFPQFTTQLVILCMKSEAKGTANESVNKCRLVLQTLKPFWHHCVTITCAHYFWSDFSQKRKVSMCWLICTHNTQAWIFFSVGSKPPHIQ